MISRLLTQPVVVGILTVSIPHRHDITASQKFLTARLESSDKFQFLIDMISQDFLSCL